MHVNIDAGYGYIMSCVQVSANVATLWKHLRHFQIDLQPPTPASALPEALTALLHLSLTPRGQRSASCGNTTAAMSPCGAGVLLCLVLCALLWCSDVEALLHVGLLMNRGVSIVSEPGDSP